MTLNDFFTSGYHLLTAAQLETYDFNFFDSDTGIIGGLDTLENVVKMKYGFSSLLPVTVAEIQKIVLGVLCMYREKYTHWWDFLSSEYNILRDYSRDETYTRDTDITTGANDRNTKTNTGTQTNAGTNSETRTDNLTATTTHGATVTNSTNSYDSAAWKNADKSATTGTDSVANTGTQGTQGSASNTRTDNLSQVDVITKSGTHNTDETIARSITGLNAAPADMMIKELKLFQSNFLDNMSSDICSYITMFDFNFTGVDFP